MKTLWWQLSHWLGVPQHIPSLREQVAAVLTAAAGIAVVFAGSLWLAPPAAPLLLASMGATAVLVFAVPHGPLSQPWAVLGGHGLSALVGLLVAHSLGSGLLAAALAVGLAIGVMHVGRCIHPPGGATALSIVQTSGLSGAPDVYFLLTPVLLNVLLILAAAIAFNFPLRWRRYPAHFAQRVLPVSMPQLSHEAPFSERELAQALDGLDMVLDISDQQLQALYEALLRGREQTRLLPQQLVPGGYYSNGLQGEAWAVRQIIDSNAATARKPQLIVKTVAGQGRGAVQLVSRTEFVVWARYPVYPGQGQWQREPVVER